MIDCRGCTFFIASKSAVETNYCARFSVQLDNPVPNSICKGLGYTATTKKEAVNHPVHYQGKIEVIDIMESIVTSMDLTPWEAALTSQVVKYIGRWKNKGGVEDLKKAEWYLKKLIEEVEK